MKTAIGRPIALSQFLADVAARDRVRVFARLSLAIADSVADGTMRTEDAVRLFFNSENGLFVRRKLKNTDADEIMSHGVQLPDLFDMLPASEARTELKVELAAIRRLCRKLLKPVRVGATPSARPSV